MISLRRRIFMGSAVLTALVVGLAVGLAFAVARWNAVAMLDRELALHAKRLQRMAALGPPQPPWPGPRERRDPLPPGWDGERRRLFIDVVDGEGGRDPRLPEDSADSPDLPRLLADLPEGGRGWRTLEDGRRLRVLRVAAAAGPERRPLRGYFAIDATATDAELNRLAATLAAVWVVAALLALLAAWWLRRSVVGPLDRLADDLRRIDPELLDGRVRESVPAEMAAAARLLNELLARLAELREREKGTIAAIAHELRSPVAGLRTALEVAALDPGCTGPRLAERLLPTVAAMHTMIGNLLALARLDAGHDRVEPRPVDLDALVDACWAQARPTAAQRGVALRREAAMLGSVTSCPDRLRMVLGNLLDNAACHAPAGATVVLRGGRGEGGVRLEIANPCDGPGPDPALAFAPFWRGDRARSSPLHCGLGLALCKRLCGLLGIALEVAVRDGSFTAVLAIPPVMTPHAAA